MGIMSATQSEEAFRVLMLQPIEVSIDFKIIASILCHDILKNFEWFINIHIIKYLISYGPSSVQCPGYCAPIMAQICC